MRRFLLLLPLAFLLTACVIDVHGGHHWWWH